jgi:hypothetical protein
VGGRKQSRLEAGKLERRTKAGKERWVLLELLEDIGRDSTGEQVQVFGVSAEDCCELLETLSRGHEIARLKLRDDGAGLRP